MNQILHDHLMNIAHALDALADLAEYSSDIEICKQAINSYRIIRRYIDDQTTNLTLEQEEINREITQHRQNDL